MRGKVKEYDKNRGYGVILDVETGQPFTVYANYINLKEGEDLKKDQEVEYDVENAHNNKWAVNVTILK